MTLWYTKVSQSSLATAFLTAGHCAQRKDEERYDKFVSHPV
jgi:hypothetical protein